MSFLIYSAHQYLNFQKSGSEAYYSGRYNFAVEEYSKVIANNPGDAAAYLARGKAYSMLKDYFSSALIYDLLNTNIYFMKGEHKNKEDDFKAAIQDLTIILKINPAEGRDFYKRGLDYVALKIEGCEDLLTACDTGYFNAYEAINKYCKREAKPGAVKRKNSLILYKTTQKL